MQDEATASNSLFDPEPASGHARRDGPAPEGWNSWEEFNADYDAAIYSEYWDGWIAYYHGLPRVIPENVEAPGAWELGYDAAQKNDVTDEAEAQFERDMIEIPEQQYCDELEEAGLL